MKKITILIAFFALISWQANAQYCTAGPSFTGDSNIETVDLLGDAASALAYIGCPGVLGLEDLTGSQSVNLTAGSSYTANVLFGTCGSNYSGAGEAWIDWNQNGTFEVSESIGTWTGTPSATNTATAMAFTVPAGAFNCNTRMRVMQWEGGSLPLNPCGTYNWGSVVDFSVVVSGGAAPLVCAMPIALTATNVTFTTADLGWTESCVATAWDIEWDTAGFTATGVPTIAGLATTSYSLTSLTANTNYTFYVRASCSATDSSDWAGPYSFFTGHCIPNPSSVDGIGITNVTMGSINNSTVAEAGNYGDYSAMITDAYQSTSLNIDITYQTGYTYDTWVWVDWNGNLDFTDAGEEYYIGNSSNANPTTISGTIAIPATANLGTVRIRIGGADVDLGSTSPSNPCYTASYGSFEDYSLNVLPAPTCIWPDTLTVANITATGADLGWSEMGTSTNWVVEYGAAGFTLGAGAGNTVATATNPYSATSLVALTNYEFYVRSNCGSGDSSIWIGPKAFTTGCTGSLSGTYTLDPTAGASTTNFVSMDKFQQALDICGISGAVTLNVATNSGPYIGPWDFTAITGSSATNTVTINGNGNIVNNNLSENHFVRFNAVSYFTVNDFEFINTTPTSGMFGIQIQDSSYNISITNNTIDVGMSNTSSVGAIVASNSNTSPTSSGDNGFNLTITGNEIIGGSYGVSLYGQSSNYNSGHVITNNNIHDFYGTGIRVYYVDSVMISGNEVSRSNRSTLTTFYGVYLRYATNCKVLSNTIHSNGVSSSTAYGIYVYRSPNVMGSETEIVNNAVYGFQSTGGIYGLYFDSTRDYINVYHNTVDISTSGTSSRYGIYMSSAPNNHNVKNNIVSITGDGTGSKYGMYISTTSASFIADNNDVYVNSAGTDYYGRWSSNRSTLADWQTASSQGANSSEDNPVFANISNGNYSPLSMNIDNMGALVGVTSDIAGVTRSATTPDVGALEFTGIPGDLEMTDAALVRVNLCYGSADSAFAMVSNLLGSTVDFATDPLTIVWMVTGPVNTTDSLVVNAGTIAVGADSIFSIATIDMSIPGDYNLSAYIRPNAVNVSLLNDTLTDVYMETVVPLITVSTDSVTVTSPFDMPTLSSTSPLYPAGGFLITEITQWSTSTGAPVAGTPAYVTTDDRIEITGVPNSDLDGFTLEVWTNSSLNRTFTFNPGTILSATGTAVIGLGTGADSPANNYYVTGGTNNSYYSSLSSGYIIKSSSGSIVDAVAYSSYSFPAAAGVSAADWSGTALNGSGTSGLRLLGADLNSPTGWIISSNTDRQDPNIVNTGVIVPSPAAVAGIVWDSAGTTVGTMPDIDAGAFTVSGIYPYIISYTSVCGTYSDTSIVTVDLTNATISASVNILCNGGDNGTATVTPGGGDAPYTYLWSNGDTTAMADSLMVGTHTVTVYDANMWPAEASVTLTEPTAISGTTSTTPSTCGVPSGSATVVATGGTGAYTYLWSDVAGSTTTTATGLVGGAYTVTITDANMCTLVENATVTDIGAPSITIVVDNIVTCFGDSNGTVTASGVGGTTPYGYAWSSGGTSDTETGLPFGAYTVTLTDNSGCISTQSVNMTQNPALLAVVTGSTNPLCNGDATGTATAIAGGGIAPYSYDWSNGDAIANASNLTAGAYTLTVTDNVGCMQTANVNIGQPNQLAGTFVNVMDVDCNGSSTGSAGLLASGGTAPYTYSWSNSSTMSSASALASGYVVITVTDANSCTMEDSVSISEPAALMASTSGIVNVSCFGGNNGMATASAIGGTMPYVYSWSNGSGGTITTGLMAGSHVVTVSDANNCMSLDTVMVTEPSTAVSATLTSSSVSCNGLQDGGAMAVGTGGTPSYSYMWSNGSTMGSISGVGAGSYSVTTTDANGCTSNGSVMVVEPTMLMATTTSTDVTCNAGNDGQTVASANGGTAPYSYVWSNGPTMSLNDTVMAGSYSVTIMDANGCSANATVTVTEPMAVMVDLGLDVTICSDDMFTLDAGTGFASYAWDDATTMQTRVIDAAAVGAGAANYYVSVLNAAGCEGSDTVEVTVGMPVTTSIVGMNALCDYETGTLDAGPGFSSYMWSNTSSSQVINVYASSYPAGNQVFTVTVTDANGCEGIAMDTVVIHPEVMVDLGADTAVWQNAVYTIEADSGYASYQWNTGANTQNLDVTVAGTYTLSVTDSITGCIGTDEIVIDFVLGVNQVANAQLKLYPNPAVDYINLEFSNFGNKGAVQIRILTITGQLVKSQMVDVSSSNGIGTIDVSNLAVGTYMVNFNYEGQQVVKQFTIK